MKPINKLNLNGKKIIIFDMDGTLIDSVRAWDVIDQGIIRELTGFEADVDTINNDFKENAKKHSGRDAYLHYYALTNEKYGLNKSAEELLQMSEERGALFYAKCDYKQNADCVLNKLLELGFTLVLATNTPRMQVDSILHRNEKMIKKADFKKVFDLILAGDMVANKKPNPEIYLKVLYHYNVKPDECLVIEDAFHGVQAAKKAGMDAAWINDVYSAVDEEEIARLADFKIESWTEFHNWLRTR